MIEFEIKDNTFEKDGESVYLKCEIKVFFNVSKSEI